MRSKIFMYLFIFAALYIVFQYVNAKKAKEFFTEKVEKLEEKTKQQKEKLAKLEVKNAKLRDKYLDVNYFSLEGNDNAISYYTSQDMEVEEIAAGVKNEIISRNKAREDNELVPFTGMEGPMRINNMRILNHRWIIADFTDGIYWGEVLLRYEVNDQGGFEINTLEALLYPGRR